MIGAMPAVAVRHERRKGGGNSTDKRNKRPSHLYIGGHWLPPTSPSPTPSPNGPHDSDRLVPEYYLCGKLSILQIIVGALLLGSIVFVVGLVQLMPNAADADHRFFFLTAGSCLLVGGIIMTAVRYFCMRRRYTRHTTDEPPPAIDAVNSIDVLVQRKDTQATLPSELEILIEEEKGENEQDKDAPCQAKDKHKDDKNNEQLDDSKNKRKTKGQHSNSHSNSNTNSNTVSYSHDRKKNSK